MISQVNKKEYNFSQSCVLEAGGQKGRMMVDDHFRENEIDMAMVMRPVFSNNKKRKDNIKSNQNSSKMSTKNNTKKITKANSIESC